MYHGFIIYFSKQNKLRKYEQKITSDLQATSWNAITCSISHNYVFQNLKMTQEK